MRESVSSLADFFSYFFPLGWFFSYLNRNLVFSMYYAPFELDKISCMQFSLKRSESVKTLL